MGRNYEDDGFSFAAENRKKDAVDASLRQQFEPSAPLKSGPDMAEVKAEIHRRRAQGGSGNTSAGSPAGTVNNRETAEVRDDSQSVAGNASVNTAAKPAPIDDITDAAPPKKPAKQPAPKPEKPQQRLKTQPKPVETDVEFIRDIPVDVMNAIRRVFPDKLNKVDLLSAFVYVHTGGGCKISKKAQAAVDRYNGDKTDINISAKLTDIETLLKEIRTSNTAVELGVACHLQDRLFGVRRTADNSKNQLLRDTGTLDMLKNLRKSGKDQATLDAEDKGREIHEIRSLNDYGGKKK